MRRTLTLCAALAITLLTGTLSGCASATRLDSWRETDSRERIVDFVARVSTPGSPEYVEPEARIAVFDNDGTLWAEQPAYFQILFAMDRIRTMAPDHPEWRTQEPYRSVLENDQKGLAAAGTKGLLEIIGQTHAGMTTDEFDAIVRDWLDTARHPTTGKRYTEMVYQPMLELLGYLRAHGFRTYIVSGGGIDFMRAFAEEVYGVPPEQVIGSRGVVSFEVRGGVPALVKQPDIDFIDDESGKPVNIHNIIGRRPIAAFGNSDGDLDMLLWTDAGTAPSLCAYVHHTDSEREWAYDRQSHIGKLDKGLDEALARDWVIIDMQQDWSEVFSALND